PPARGVPQHASLDRVPRSRHPPWRVGQPLVPVRAAGLVGAVRWVLPRELNALVVTRLRIAVLPRTSVRAPYLPKSARSDAMDSLVIPILGFFALPVERRRRGALAARAVPGLFWVEEEIGLLDIGTPE